MDEEGGDREGGGARRERSAKEFLGPTHFLRRCSYYAGQKRKTVVISELQLLRNPITARALLTVLFL